MGSKVLGSGFLLLAAGHWLIAILGEIKQKIASSLTLSGIPQRESLSKRNFKRNNPQITQITQITIG
jgi:hypothetical protein